MTQSEPRTAQDPMWGSSPVHASPLNAYSRGKDTASTRAHDHRLGVNRCTDVPQGRMRLTPVIGVQRPNGKTVSRLELEPIFTELAERLVSWKPGHLVWSVSLDAAGVVAVVDAERGALGYCACAVLDSQAHARVRGNVDGPCV